MRINIAGNASSRTIYFKKEGVKMQVYRCILNSQGFSNILDQYEVREKISGDFNNKVFRATHRLTGSKVVIKQICAEKYANESKKQGIGEIVAHELCKNEHVVHLMEHF